MTLFLKSFASAVAFLICVAGASATTISFDEHAAPNNGVALSGSYGATGASFSATNAGIWGGNSQGNPGVWDLEGTNGSQFLGFNGSNGYSEIVTFSVPISFFSADFSRSLGSSDGSITLSAFDGATPLGSTSATLGGINSWTTLSLAYGGITSIQWTGSGTDFHPFGVDNLVFANIVAVPVPGTLALFAAGLGGLGLLRSRRKGKVRAAA